MLILVLVQWYYNCYISLELASKYNLWQVGSVLFFNGIPEIHGWSRIYVHSTQTHGMWWITHMEWPNFGSKMSDNDYPTPLLHEALDVEQKMVMMEIGSYYNKFSHLCVQQQHYPEYDIICLSIFSYLPIFLCFNWSMNPYFRCYLDRYFWNSLSRLKSFFCVQECMIICKSNVFDPDSWTFDINWYI